MSRRGSFVSIGVRISFPVLLRGCRRRHTRTGLDVVTPRVGRRLLLLSPGDALEIRNHSAPYAVSSSRGAVVLGNLADSRSDLPIGAGAVIRAGQKLPCPEFRVVPDAIDAGGDQRRVRRAHQRALDHEVGAELLANADNAFFRALQLGGRGSV